MSEWKPGDIANGHVLGDDLVWRPIEEARADNPPADPPTYPAPPPGNQSAPDSRGRAISITALVVAGISLLLCWVPIVNNVVFFLGLIGLVLGLVGASQSRKRRAGGGAGLAVAAVAISALAMGGVIATQAFYSSLFSGGDSETSDSEAASSATPQPIGASAKVGSDYLVAVTDVNLDANSEVSAANSYNDAPIGRFVIATVRATYIGDDEGEPSYDLDVAFAGTDSRNYSDCSASLRDEDEQSKLPSLRNGGKAEFKVCFDVAADAIDGGRVVVEDYDDRVYWDTE